MTLIKNPKRALILVMSALTFCAVIFAIFYYQYNNKSVDPRVIDAREMYSRYDALVEDNNYNAVFSLLDSIQTIYNATNHYQNSFETGVIYNNRAAVYLSMAIHHEGSSLSLDGITTLSKDSLLNLSEKACSVSITIYTSWLKMFENQSREDIRQQIRNDFFSGLEAYSEKEKNRFLSKRIKELIEAQTETPRRLSVALTNMGIVKRHQGDYQKAADNYQQALELWDRNLAAENSLNSLLGQPHRKQNTLEKLFPPDKDK